MCRIRTLLIAALVAGVPMAMAQSPAGVGPEAAKLAFYVGHWSESGQSRTDPANPFTPFTGFETCEWHTGGQAVVCRESTRDVANSSHNIYILSWDSALEHYSVYGVDHRGSVYTGSGELKDGRWIWRANFNAQGASAPLRYTFAPTASGARDMTLEASDGKEGWVKLADVHYTPLE